MGRWTLRLRQLRGILFATVTGALILGDGTGATAFLHLITPASAQVLNASSLFSPASAASGKYVDPTPFLSGTKAPSTPRMVTGPSASTPKGYVDGVSREIPALRGAQTRVYANPDG